MNKDDSNVALDTPPAVFHPSWCRPESCDMGDINSGLGTYGVHVSPMYSFGNDGEAEVWITRTLRFDGQPSVDEPEAGICVDGSASLTPAEARELAETLTSLASELEPLNVEAGVA